MARPSGVNATPVSGPTLVWFRLDLRLDDHPALIEALKKGAVIPVYIHDPKSEGKWQPGAASHWWLHHSLEKLSQSLKAHGSRLIFRQGDSLTELQKLIQETGAYAVCGAVDMSRW